MAPAGGAPAAAAAAAAFPAYQADAAAEADQAATPKIHFIYADEAVSMVPPHSSLPPLLLQAPATTSHHQPPLRWRAMPIPDAGWGGVGAVGGEAS